MRGRLLIAIAIVLTTATGVLAEGRQPIIDMHVHALPAGFDGPESTGFCAPYLEHLPPFDGSATPAEMWAEFFANPPCDDPVWSPSTDDGVRDETLARMEANNVIGVVFGEFDRVEEWSAASPDRVIKGADFVGDEGVVDHETFRQQFIERDFAVFAEIAPQYLGLSPLDPQFDPFWAMAEELQIPVGFHLVDGVPSLNMTFAPKHRNAVGNPMLLEEILVRHPRLRLFVMHYGSPLVDEMIAIMNTFPQVYVEIGGIPWVYPREYFYQQLEQMVDAGFGKRIMFGSDHMVWPGLIDFTIEVVEQAPFLSAEQKRDIFYNNAARFLQLDEEEIARHHER